MNALHPATGAARIVFVDPCSAGGYDLPDLATGGLGGTEATVLRVASSLVRRFDVTHFQNGRTRRHCSDVGHLCMLQDLDGVTGDVIVVLNRWKVALKLRRHHPDTPIFLWLHVYPGRHNRRMGAALKAAGITVVCVSRTHAAALADFLGPDDTPPLRVIYNPIDDGLQPDDTPRNRDRLLFASSPHKGLGQVFRQFANLRRPFPDLTLAVADPGYLGWDTGPVPDGVVFLGSLSHPALIRQMRRALCLFYPQTGFAETFGLVLAEANAVGTPVLVHDGLGANAEIVADPAQRVDGTDAAQIHERVAAWRRNPVQVAGNPDFRLKTIADTWARLLRQAASTRLHLSAVSS